MALGKRRSSSSSLMSSLCPPPPISLSLSLSVEGADAVLPCLIGPRDDPREQLTWSWGGKRIPLRWLNSGGPGLGARVGPLGISLIILNVSDNTGGFYLCEKNLEPENQTEPGNRTTLGAAVSVEGSDKRFLWNPPKEGVGDCGPRKGVSPKPLPYGDFPNTSESSGPSGLPPPNDSNPLLLYVWNRDGPQLWGKLPPCVDTESSHNQTGDPLELTSSPGSPLWLPCGSPLASPFQGLVTWVLFHPGSLSPTPLLSLELGKGALVRELWVLGTPRGGSLLLLPHATPQDAGVYHCHLGNLTYDLQLTIVSRPVWRWMLGAKGWKVPAIALAYVTISLAVVVIFLQVKRGECPRNQRTGLTLKSFTSRLSTSTSDPLILCPRILNSDFDLLTFLPGVNPSSTMIPQTLGRPQSLDPLDPISPDSSLTQPCLPGGKGKG
uniref:Ig-like domain-containing protein n=1 Tax=Ornithorhynchus anatinus TaxID=9258 RepID=A0A6I8P9Y3_ORNAN